MPEEDGELRGSWHRAKGAEQMKTNEDTSKVASTISPSHSSPESVGVALSF